MLNFNYGLFLSVLLQVGLKRRHTTEMSNTSLINSPSFPHSLFLNLSLYLFFTFYPFLPLYTKKNTNTETTVLHVLSPFFYWNKKMRRDETRGPTTEEDFLSPSPKTTAESASIIVARFTNTVKHTVSMCARTAFCNGCHASRLSKSRSCV